MNSDDHARLLAVARKWERIAADKDVEIAELKKRVVWAETAAEGLKALDDRYERVKLAFEMNHEMTYHEMCDVIARLRALVSWIDGMCVDLADHMEIRAAINRYWESLK